MQHLNFTELKRLEDPVKKSKRADFLRIWRLLGTSDHYYYMCTKGMGDGSVHEYFSHHGNPFDAAINYHAVLSDFKERVITHNLKNNIRYWEGEQQPKEQKQPQEKQAKTKK